jgi:transcriptional regulator with XRE-family HTH domain
MKEGTFGQWLKKMLAEKEMTQVELSEMTGITVPTICGYVHDRRVPSWRTAVMLAEFFGKRVVFADKGQEE